MSYFFKSMGVFLLPMILFMLAIVGLSIWKIFDLYFRRGLGKARMERGLHAIMFWGILSAVFGFLGQITGVYNALQAISKAKEISPQVIAQGLAQSYTTTIFGVEMLLVAGIVWFLLLGRYRKLSADL